MVIVGRLEAAVAGVSPAGRWAICRGNVLGRGAAEEAAAAMALVSGAVARGTWPVIATTAPTAVGAEAEDSPASTVAVTATWPGTAPAREATATAATAWLISVALATAAANRAT